MCLFILSIRKDKQECIPVGCVPFTAVAVSPGGGVSAPGAGGGVCSDGVSAPGGYPSMH